MHIKNITAKLKFLHTVVTGVAQSAKDLSQFIILKLNLLFDHWLVITVCFPFHKSQPVFVQLAELFLSDG